jgi:hypothetical protein
MNISCMKLLYRIVILLIVFCSIPTFAYAATYYVSQSGSGDCSSSSPCSVTTGMGNASAGSTIIFTSGNYPRITISKSGQSDSPITFQAQSGAITKGFEIGANYVTIDGFKITKTDFGGFGDYEGSAGIYANGTGNLIESNTIEDASMDGIYIAGSSNTVRNNVVIRAIMAGIDIHGTGTLVEGNDVSHSVQCPIPVPSGCNADNGWDADGMRFFGSGHTFRGNKIHDILKGETINGTNVNIDPHTDCFQTGSWGAGGVGKDTVFEQNYCKSPTTEGSTGWTLENNSNNLTIRNNIIIAIDGIDAHGGNPTADNLHVYNNVWINANPNGTWRTAAYLQGVPHADYKNNIFYNYKGEAATLEIGSGVSNLIVDYNLAYNDDGTTPSHSYYTQAHNSLWGVNPQFVNPTLDSNNYDYHLKSVSPACTGGEGGTYVGAYPCGSGGSTPIPTATSARTPTPTSRPATSPTPVRILGDATGDGLVNEDDYTVYLTHYGKSVSTGTAAADFNDDGKVDGIDYIIWLTHV